MATHDAKLAVRRLLPTDARSALEVMRAPQVLRRFPSFPKHPDIAWIEARLAASSGAPATQADHWGGFEDGAMVCLVTLTGPVQGALSLSYAVAPWRWNEGVGTEASARVIRQVAAEAECPIRLEAASHSDNRASGRVLEKLGFWRWGNRLERDGEVALFHRVVTAPASDLAIVLERAGRRMRSPMFAAA